MRRREQRGAALVVVLLLLAIASILAAEFLYAIRIQSILLGNYENRVRARAAAQAGQNAAAGLLTRADPEEPQYFNNPATGIQLFNYRCMGGSNTSVIAALSASDTFTPPPAAPAPDPLAGGTAGQDGCGYWSLTLPYQLEDIGLEINIEDEQARLNLNAMVTSQVDMVNGVPQESFKFNRANFCAVYELFRYEVFRRQLEISDADVLAMVQAITDYLDYGEIDGAFDKDQITTFQVGDDYYPMKDGPLDTVDEIKLVPGMTDELYDAVEDFLTVYPTAASQQSQMQQGFSMGVNFNAAPLEVIYAIIRGAAANDEFCRCSITEDAAMKAANTVVQSSFDIQAGGASGMQGGQAQTQAGMVKYNRDITPMQQLSPQITGFTVNHQTTLGRFFRVRVVATSPNGQETTITRVVVKRPNLRKPLALYYRED